MKTLVFTYSMSTGRLISATAINQSTMANNIKLVKKKNLITHEKQTLFPLTTIGRLYGVSKAFIYKMKREQNLTLFKLGSVTYVDLKEYEQLIIKYTLSMNKSDDKA